MYINTNELILYKHFDCQDIFDDITWIINNYESRTFSKDNIKSRLYEGIYKLIEFSVSHGFEGNLLHCYLTYILITNENAFSKACEISGKVSGTITSLALNDLIIFKKLYNFDLSMIDEALDIDCFRLIKGYVGMDNPKCRSELLPYIKDLTSKLSAAKGGQDFYNVLTDFYKQFGVGKFGLNKAFRVIHHKDTLELRPITNTEPILLSDLVGYELQKNELVKNTEAFVQGRKANNILLYGDSGTGKSSSIKAILNEYYSKGLRMIEVYKHQMGDLPFIIDQIKDRSYRFVIYMDDLSFEDYETDYKYLKAVIEGGLEPKPDNVLIYATSNRRHLIREKWSDKNDRDDELHTSDTVQEKLSLSSRFGLPILYIAPSKKEYEHIVKVLADKYHIEMPEEELYLEANRWELRNGGLSGRTAQHFITYLLGKSE
ncbi:MAG TPA: ATP-binding protein [Ruminiclostridium sp.]|nr:ATP-binding protein [Ruminiclostridium sp.]